MQGTPQNTKSWPCWGREGSWGWYLWVCHCSHGLSDLLRRVETGKTKITCKGRSSSCYQPKASPALVAAPAKGRMKLQPVWGLLHMTVPREHWDSGGFRYRQKILRGLSCRSQGSGTGSAQLCWLSRQGCIDCFSMSTAGSWNFPCGTNSTIQHGKVGSMGWFGALL